MWHFHCCSFCCFYKANKADKSSGVAIWQLSDWSYQYKVQEDPTASEGSRYYAEKKKKGIIP